ncbi:FAD/NAD(P)-binding oxidoreductase [Chelativorans sp. Marseille-P2723]|uniref:FAD/NAD(P)-dependent oxidoreductase n=1 Tax=Chelativorans sp. Marseille-P2723 TaxID=2709133 RepID=UPI00156F9E08|nr:FAD/NAD(P)-binding oxidoreductase [Chelativorans sp. Marseille-P2723]
MKDAHVNLAIIGAGPAGMSAALRAKQFGLSVAVFDEQPTPGGQIYRDVMRSRSQKLQHVLGADYAAGKNIAQPFLDAGIDYYPGSTVWRVAPGELSWTSKSGSGELLADRILAATGAMERPFPIGGWTLPGVMTAGAAQILLKLDGVVADDAVFIGCGPLLYLIVNQYLEAGVKVRALLDTAPGTNWFRAAKHVAGALCSPSYLMKGLKLLSNIQSSGVPYYSGVESVRIMGTTKVAGVHWNDGRRDFSLECENVFLHQGIIPNINLTMAARCDHHWDDLQACFRPVVDPFGRTSCDWLVCAGDGAGIVGARSAALSGEIAALAIMHDLGFLKAADFRRETVPLLRLRRKDQRIRPFLDARYLPLARFRSPTDPQVTICRCEEVRREEISRALSEGCPGPNQFKSFTRAGMGPCQGRMCGNTVVESFCADTGSSPDAVGYYRLRMPVKPVTIAEIGGL